jgi:hypothetical protein
MRNHRVSFSFMFAVGLLAFPLWTLSGPSAQPTPRTFTGEVTDAICAKSGSHDEMMAKMQSMGRDKETCTRKCAQLGAKYVLYDEADKAVYNLDNQSKAQTFAGRRVRVAGTLDGKQIRVTDVRAIG